MSEKPTTGKLAGVVFCIAAAVCTVLLMFAGSYFGGQMKVIDKYLTALERDDFKGYTECFPDSTAKKLTEKDLEAAQSVADMLDDKEDFRVTADFKERQRLEAGKYAVTFDVTVYNESEHKEIKDVTCTLIHKGSGWVIDAEA